MLKRFKVWLLKFLYRDAGVLASSVAARAIERSLRRELSMSASHAKQAAGCAVRALQRAGFARSIERKESSHG